MLIPELPSYLTSIGGAEYKGLIVALFTLTAGISRPFSGRLTDTLGRVPVMAFGSVVCFVCGFLYPVLSSVSGFLLLRLFHGFSTGFKPTATAAYVADIVPRERWGEALGMYGIFFSTGLAIGPAIGSTIRMYYSMNVLFYASSVFALLSILIIYNMQETLMVKHKFHPSLLRLTKHDLFSKEVLPAAIVTFLSYAAYGSLLTLIPDWSAHLGILNKGLFFLVLTLASLVIRFVAGKLSDEHGRVRVIIIGLGVHAIGLFLVGYSESVFGMLLGSAIYGVATGIISPAINAWTVDLSHVEHRGKGLATMYIAMEAGIGLAALGSGFYYANVIERVPHTMYASAFLGVAALVYLFFLVPGRLKENRREG